MTLSRPILMATVLSPAILQAEERSYPIQDVGFEVVVGDPSCSGRNERLVRARLETTSTFQEVGSETGCALGIRRGVDVESQELPCKDAFGVKLDPDQRFQPGDTLSLTADLNICQGLWDHRISLSDAVLSGSYSGVAFDPIELVQDDAWINDYERTSEFGRVDVVVQCNAPTKDARQHAFDATFFFQLIEFGAVDCSKADCAEAPKRSVIRPDQDWTHVGLVTSCAPSESGAAP